MSGGQLISAEIRRSKAPERMSENRHRVILVLCSLRDVKGNIMLYYVPYFTRKSFRSLHSRYRRFGG